MRKISFWAKNHKWTARLIIVVSSLVMNYVAIKTGLLLNQMQFFISGTAMAGICGFYMLGIALYPSKVLKAKWGISKFYIRQKTCDLILVSASFGMMVFFGNQLGNNGTSSNAKASSVAYSYLLKDSSIKKYKSVTAFAASMKDENGKMLKWKERKKLLKEQVKELKKTDDLSKGQKTGLIILSIVIALGLWLLVLGLSCNLSCSGADGAAALVGIGGTALIIFLLILVIRGIKKKKNKQEISSTPAKE